MNTTLAALYRMGLPSTLAGWGIALIVICGVVGIVIVVVKVTEIKIPWWVITILWILAVCGLGIVGIKFLTSMQ